MASVVGAALLARPANAYDPSCQVHTINQLNAIAAAVAGTGGQSSKTVNSLLQQSKSFLERGSDVNHELQQAIEQAEKAARSDPSIAAREEQLKAERKTIDVHDPAQVRDDQRKVEELQRLSAASRDKQIFADPKVDRIYAEDTQLQIKSDLSEGSAIVKSVLAPRPPDPDQVTQAVAAAAAHLQLGSNLMEKATNTQAYRDGLTALAVAQSIAATGNVDEKYRLALTKFDTGADVAAQVQADHLVAGMAFERIGGTFGGSPNMPEVRQAMGPDARRAVSAQMSIALEKSNVILQESQIMRDSLKIHEPPAPHPKTEAELAGAVKAYTAAIKDAKEKIQKYIWGSIHYE